MGFNALLARLGLGKESTAEGTRSPSAIVGSLVSIAILLFAITEAANLLGFAALSDLIAQFLVFAGHVIFGLVLFGIGLERPAVVCNYPACQQHVEHDYGIDPGCLCCHPGADDRLCGWASRIGIGDKLTGWHGFQCPLGAVRAR